MIKVKFEGGKELEAALAKLPAKVSAAVLRSALMKGGKPMFERITDLYLETWQPDRRSSEEAIARNIRISPVEDQAGAPSVAIGPAENFAFDTLREFGTSGKAARPFYRPGFDEKQDETIKVTGDVIWEQIKAIGVPGDPE